MAENIVVNGVTYNGVDSIAMQNTEGQAVGFYPDAVRYSAQTLTEAQKAKARANIGAISEVDVPKKGVDYWTEEDQEAIVQQVITALGTPVFGRVDADKNIILSGKLVDGNYTVKYEAADGSVTVIGNLTQGVTYTNVLALATDASGNVFNGVGYADNYRFSSYGGDMSKDTSGSSGYFVTGFIPYSKTQKSNKTPWYIKGISLDLTTLPQYLRFAFVIPGSTEWIGVCSLSTEEAINSFTVTQLGENYYKFTPNSNLRTLNGWNSKETTHARWCLPGSGAGVIITIDEPIE